MYVRILCALFVMVISQWQILSGDVEEVQQPLLLEAAQKLPQTGTLKTDKWNKLFLKLDNGYVNLPTPYDNLKRFTSKEGPTLKVVTEKEAKQKGVTKFDLKEIGQQITFKVSKVVLIHLNKGLTYVALKVDSPELEQLRTKNGFEKYPDKHDGFYIYLGELRK